MENTYANQDVLNFYRIMPFNLRKSLKNEQERVRQMTADKLYPPLAQILKKELSVLEVGCGVGWLSNSINYLYKSPVTGIDFNPVAIDRAKEIGHSLRLNTIFEAADLFLYNPPKPFDIVISFGVLHHTNDCLKALQRICEKFVRPEGLVVVGLYHKYGRQPFLDYFEDMKRRGVPEEDMFSKFKELHPILDDETHLMSWFRDQVLIPHETQHTLDEILPVLDKSNMELISTSINHFEPIKDVRGLMNEEKSYRELALQRLKEKKYFPGFFVFVAKKRK